MSKNLCPENNIAFENSQTIDAMPDPDACELNYWMSKALEAMNQ